MVAEINSIFLSNIEKGIKAGIITVSDNQSKITYHCARECTFNFKNPEEKVRGSYFAELVLDYLYPAENIDIEVKVERRIPDDRADIVVYEDEETKTPFLIVETKKDGITDAEFKQAIEQAFGNANSKRAKYAVVVAGNTKTAFDVAGYKSSEREKNVIADIPIKYGKAPKYKFIKGDEARDLKIVSRQELMQTLQKCHDTVWQGGKLAPTTAFDEVSKLLFCKLKDEKDKPNGDYYDFQIGTHETTDEVFKRVDKIYQRAKKEDEDVFKEDIRLEAKILYQIVEHLQSIAINEVDLDTKGMAFEKFMEDFFKGKMGQFFTPRPVIDFCVRMVKPNFRQKVLDPACGSGGFLLHSMDYIRKFVEVNYKPMEAYMHWHNFAKENLYGIEINDQIARVCKMNMIIHDDGHTNVIRDDSLNKIEEIEKGYPKFKRDSFDLVLTNPPFGATVKSIEREKGFMEEYYLGAKTTKRPNQKTEILFIERCLDFLKPSTGVMAIVLPDSITVNSSLQYVRDFILERFQVLAVISLPDFAFTHFGANVKSSLLFLRKKGKQEVLGTYPVFMAIAEKVGYTATGKEEASDFPRILEYYEKFTKEGVRLKIDEALRNKVFITGSNELEGRRIDPKGYTVYFRELKKVIEEKGVNCLPLRDCILESVAGEWGLDLETEEDLADYEMCYVLRNTNFDNNFNLDFSDVAIRYIEKKKISKLKLVKNDILIEKSGGSPTQPVGRVAIVLSLIHISEPTRPY